MSDAKTSRLSRLTAIQTMLQARQLLTAREVADKFDISLRTVYRDIRALARAGVPICTEEGRGYTLVAGYTLPPVALSEREANAYYRRLMTKLPYVTVAVIRSSAKAQREGFVTEN